MSKRFRHRYRIASARAQWWDYGWNGAYYVTICTKDRECIFGDVICDVPKPYVQLSEIGQIAYQYWEEIPDHFPFAELGEFIVMPNHLHGIVIIDRPGNEPNSRVGYVPPSIVPGRTCTVETPKLGVSTAHPDENPNPNNMHLHPDENPDSVNPDPNAARWKPGTLGVIINQYKRKCTIEARTIRKNFGWQSRFHDHIIRDEDEFQRISEYIRNNPANWKNDRFYRG